MSSVNDGNAKGQRNMRFQDLATKGVPRMDNLLTVRMLRSTHPVAMLVDKVKNQVKTTDWAIVPDVPEGKEVTEEHIRAAEDLENWMDGGFNQNPNTTFEKLQNKILLGMLGYDAGVVECVPGSDGFVNEMYARDGMVFTKNPDKHNRLPQPPQPAYYQFGTSFIGLEDDVLNVGDDDKTLRELANLGGKHRGVKPVEPIGFSRDQILWFEEDPQEDHPYGFGKVQKIKRLAETILNQDIHKNRMVSDTEYSEGLLNFVGLSQDRTEDVREYWRDEVKGDPTTLPITGAENAEYIPISPNPTELQFLESQQWYIKLAAMVFGLNSHEIGNGDDLAQNIGEQQSEQVHRNTTKPLLDNMQATWNLGLLPITEPYNRVDGELKFVYNPTNKMVERKELETNIKRLQAQATTPNEIRAQEGKEEFGEWADLPLAAIQSVARSNPEAIAEAEDLDLDLDSGAESLLQADMKQENSESMWDSWDYVFDNPSEVLIRLADAVRNERSGDFPPLKSEEDNLTQEVGKVFLEVQDDLEEMVKDEFPEEEKDGEVLVNADALVEQLDFAGRLEEVLVDNNIKALQKGAEHEASKVEGELEEQSTVPSEVQINIDFDLTDTLAMESLRRRTAKHAEGIEDTVKSRIANTILSTAEDGGTVNDVQEELDERFENLSSRQARTVARTEVISSSREGQQAFQEDSDVVDGKKWRTTQDGRQRDWHDAMNGVVKKVNKRFTVPNTGADNQPDDYPRGCMVVGNDQPYNCRCTQNSVLADDLPDDVNSLVQNYEGVSLDGELTEKQVSVYCEYREEGEDSFKEVFGRMVEEKAMSEMDGEVASKPTLYEWKKEVAG